MPNTSTVSEPFEVSHRQVFVLAVPMMLSFISTPLLGIVDTAVIGQLGNAALLGAIALGAVLFDLVFGSFNFLRYATTGMTAQALGARNFPEMQIILIRSALIAITFGFLFILLQWPIREIGLAILGATDTVYEAAKIYTDIRIWSAPFVLFNYAIFGCLVGLKPSVTAITLVALGTSLPDLFASRLAAVGEPSADNSVSPFKCTSLFSQPRLNAFFCR